MAESYDEWMNKVRAALDSLNLPMADWQVIGAFDYRSEYEAGVKPDDAAMKANRYWRHGWNKSLRRQDCLLTNDCWLPRGHQGQCQPVAEESSL